MTDQKVCQKCRRSNPVWFADNDLWNKIAGGIWSFLCPGCFIDMAEAKGFVPTGWHLEPERIDGVVRAAFTHEVIGWSRAVGIGQTAEKPFPPYQPPPTATVADHFPAST